MDGQSLVEETCPGIIITENETERPRVELLVLTLCHLCFFLFHLQVHFTYSDSFRLFIYTTLFPFAYSFLVQRQWHRLLEYIFNLQHNCNHLWLLGDCIVGCRVRPSAEWVTIYLPNQRTKSLKGLFSLALCLGYSEFDSGQHSSEKALNSVEYSKATAATL